MANVFKRTIEANRGKTAANLKSDGYMLVDAVKDNYFVSRINNKKNSGEFKGNFKFENGTLIQTGSKKISEFLETLKADEAFTQRHPMSPWCGKGVLKSFGSVIDDVKKIEGKGEEAAGKVKESTKAATAAHNMGMKAKNAEKHVEKIKQIYGKLVESFQKARAEYQKDMDKEHAKTNTFSSDDFVNAVNEMVEKKNKRVQQAYHTLADKRATAEEEKAAKTAAAVADPEEPEGAGE